MVASWLTYAGAARLLGRPPAGLEGWQPIAGASPARRSHWVVPVVAGSLWSAGGECSCSCRRVWSGVAEGSPSTVVKRARGRARSGVSRGCARSGAGLAPALVWWRLLGGLVSGSPVICCRKDRRAGTRCGIVSDRYGCGLPLDPPSGGDYHWPSLEQPEGDVSAVVRYMEHPTYRRAVRADGGWMERGASVDGTGTPGLIPWERVGMCWAGAEHPVVAVREGEPRG